MRLTPFVIGRVLVLPLAGQRPTFAAPANSMSPSPRPRFLRLLLGSAALFFVSSGASSLAVTLRFDFGSSPAAPGFTLVQPDDLYTSERGFGFEPGATVTALDRLPGDRAENDFVTNAGGFYFSVDLPEGNHRVTITLGDAHAAATTTVKAELRRLLLENVTTKPGEFQRLSLVVNVRRHQIMETREVAAGEVQLKAPRETTQEAWAWDRRLTLEFNGPRPAVAALEIEPVDVPTLFLLGDSTVCDQSREPYNSWGQMLTRWFKPTVALANHGESGETYRDSLRRRRLDKILSVMRPGDTLLMQFGHNDQKQVAAGTGGPFTTYKDEIKTHVDSVRRHGGIPVIVTPMERREFDSHGKIVPSLTDYAEASRQAARELGTALVDLHAMSIVLYEALGVERSKAAFAEPEPGKLDPTHHSSFGSYELAKCVAAAIQRSDLAIAQHLVDGFAFDPAQPDNPAAFNVPPSPLFTNQRPLGDDR
ncbi:MAG TPA: rhamnogalacturonan acetylesterase [Opitutus sp.]|nr:rhamnogalacturonan acetylesterase [Opitutus sp.]